MRRLYRSALLFLLVIFALSSPVMAEASSVTYINQAERFVFVPADTDLFQNFKGVMPGDLRSQKIDVGNDSDGSIKIYMKINPVSKESEVFLQQLNLTIEDNEKVLLEERLDQQGQFSEFILLRQLEPDTQITLDITLEVPFSLSNEFMKHEAEVEWIFKVEEVSNGELPDTGNSKPPVTENPKLPKTGSLGENIWYAQGILSVTAGCFLIKKKTSLHSNQK